MKSISDKISDHEIQYSKYKWEFLRRNPEYIKEWNTFKEAIEEKYHDWWPPAGDVIEGEGEFCRKWGLLGLPNPDMSYDQMISKLKKYSSKRSIDKRIWQDVPERINNEIYHHLFGTIKFVGIQAWAINFINPHFVKGFTVEAIDTTRGLDYNEEIPKNISDSLSKTGVFTVKVNLNYSKRRLMNDFKALIDKLKLLYENDLMKQLYMKFLDDRNINSFNINKDLTIEFERIYKKELKRRKKVYEQKLHFDNFDLYLQVYDLKQEGKSWAKITEELNLNSVQTARNHYNAACELIEKGIDLYVK